MVLFHSLLANRDRCGLLEKKDLCGWEEWQQAWEEVGHKGKPKTWTHTWHGQLWCPNVWPKEGIPELMTLWRAIGNFWTWIGIKKFSLLVKCIAVKKQDWIPHAWAEVQILFIYLFSFQGILWRVHFEKNIWIQLSDRFSIFPFYSIHILVL